MQNNNSKKDALLRVKHLEKFFPLNPDFFGRPQSYLRAVDDISFDLYSGKTIGVVGESGCGKTTLGRTILKLYDTTNGKVIYNGTSIEEVVPKYYLNDVRFVSVSKKIYHYYKAKLENPELSDKAKAKYQAEIAKIIELKTETLGGLFLSDHLDEVRSVLLQNIKCIKKVNSYKKSIISFENKNLKNKKTIETLNHKISEIKDSPTILAEKKNAKIEVLNAKIEKTNLFIKTNIEKLSEFKQLLKTAEDEKASIQQKIDSFRDSLKSNELFEQFESKREYGLNLARLTAKEMRPLRIEIQLIFQDPYSSLPPRMTVGSIIAEAVKVHKIVPKNQIQDHVLQVMEKCGLQRSYYDRYPHEFSGGQRQRICIARALAVNPKLVVCDEPVSALDVSIQAQIINLLKDLQNTLGLTYIFISHDLSVVKYITDEIMVMYLGTMMEKGKTDDIFNNPLHPYTEALFSAVPVPNPDAKMNRILLTGDIPSAANPPKGCKFHTRCPKCMGICKFAVPKLLKLNDDHFVSCHLHDEEIMAQRDELEKAYDLEQEKKKEMELMLAQEKENKKKTVKFKNDEEKN